MGSRTVDLRISPNRLRVSAFALLMLLACIVGTAAVAGAEEPAAAQGGAATFDGNSPKQEVVYARLAGDGTSQGTYVVNTLNPGTSGATVIDYGPYSAVSNLTDERTITHVDDRVRINDVSDGFAYQGDLAAAQLPWTIRCTYLLDGKPMKPEQLSGATGHLVINLGVSRNHRATGDYFDNYLVTLSVLLADAYTSNISAPNASIALSGSDTQVTAMVLPGKEASYTIEADVREFRMDGVSVAAIPFSIAMDSPDTTSLMSNMNALVAGVANVNAGAGSLAEGSAALSDGATQLAQGSDSLAEGARDMALGTTDLANGSAQFREGLESTAEGGEALSGQSAKVAEGLDDLAAGGDKVLLELKQNLEAAGIPAATVQDILFELKKYTEEVSGAAKEYSQVDEVISKYTAGVSALSDNYAEIDDGLHATAQGAQQLSSGSDSLAAGTSALSDSAAQLSGGASTFRDGTGVLYTEIQTLPESMRNEIDTMMRQYDKSGFTPTSFVDARNTKVSLVQFVMTTDAVPAPEQVTEEQEPEETDFLSRLLSLFGL